MKVRSWREMSEEKGEEGKTGLSATKTTGGRGRTRGNEGDWMGPAETGGLA